MSLILKRKSVREFLDKAIPKEDIVKLLKSAMQAPSANNQQPWEFIVVDDRLILNELIKTGSGAWPLTTAPLAIIPMIKPGHKSPMFNIQDLSASTENILLEASNLGLGAVWIGAYPVEERVKHIEKTLNITGDIHPFCIIAIGYPANEPIVTLRYDESRVHYNKWGK